MTHYHNHFFGAPFKLVTHCKELLSSFSEEKNTKRAQTSLAWWVDRLLPFDYEIEHIPEKRIELVDCLSSHYVAMAPQVSEFDKTFIVAEIEIVKRQIKPSALINTGNFDRNNDVMCKTE